MLIGSVVFVGQSIAFAAWVYKQPDRWDAPLYALGFVAFAVVVYVANRLRQRHRHVST